MKKFIKEFKDFAVKGNAVDLAVAVIIGGAFGKIVSSLVADIIMPPLGLLLGGVNFSDWQWIIKSASADQAASVINIGIFLQNILDFLIIALAVFFMVKGLVMLKRQVINENKSPSPNIPSAPTKEQELLTEIRDLLKNKVN
ncbi:large-conductance mechanosensitive channel protein MscL [Candidatus Falkowbacteria bacterium]|uniref:Large-conductance mechanosensitive channel n=1 Tax=Candidatus Falkowbacteria bacterium CG10_big_fil_rev_8_21_14_0_10_37_18 TaxID=1974562 RepID=A0A2H0V8B2_9BACT|nr:large-conductance mechanosensitive channel protein MscL [Candidatus Falkowbacteria bacterium]NCQ12626.1 large-conductance mechanosensitive channel protein MscL [Candidatus Falkowbacteria bacterium]OIO05760.1 MAG: large-conductance mechanosensitive channel [Candidatus Falkowbacteria bacterium CG1_02_37_21]PIR95308.1 MAG: large conductance mechanosensitive channel protein MscL [Candidatus Falkowbacteria bacterium CG10_big_fil_rev_8_21_14_0_10_37_18]